MLEFGIRGIHRLSIGIAQNALQPIQPDSAFLDHGLGVFGEHMINHALFYSKRSAGKVIGRC